MSRAIFPPIVVVTLLLASNLTAATGKVSTTRVPDGGIQPQIAVDAKGTIHLVYYKNDPQSGDLFYVHSEDSGATFSPPIQVNSVPGSAIAMGNIRGANIALGKNGRLHVAWNGSNQATPKGPKGESPMLYTRLDDSGKAFEPQRNVIQSAYGLDGGGTVAADAAGNVYVMWGAMGETPGEKNRRIYAVRSNDEGKTFSREVPISQNTGACGCCGMHAHVDAKGNVYALYRAATENVNRDMYLLVSRDKGASFQSAKIQEWRVNGCPMSTSDFFETSAGVLAAWETRSQVYFSSINSSSFQLSTPVPAPGATPTRKHPVLASNSAGETILVWTEGMAWQQGGSVHWQTYDKSGKPISESGKADGVPVWSLVAAFAKPDGSFVVMY